MSYNNKQSSYEEESMARQARAAQSKLNPEASQRSNNEQSSYEEASATRSPLSYEEASAARSPLSYEEASAARSPLSYEEESMARQARAAESKLKPPASQRFEKTIGLDGQTYMQRFVDGRKAGQYSQSGVKAQGGRKSSDFDTGGPPPILPRSRPESDFDIGGIKSTLARVERNIGGQSVIDRQLRQLDHAFLDRTDTPRPVPEPVINSNKTPMPTPRPLPEPAINGKELGFPTSSAPSRPYKYYQSFDQQDDGLSNNTPDRESFFDEIINSPV